MSHESPKGATVEWYTPPEFFTRLGDVEFFMDPASPGKDIVPWVPANIHVTKDEDGMKSEWVGPVGAPLHRCAGEGRPRVDAVKEVR